MLHYNKNSVFLLASAGVFHGIGIQNCYLVKVVYDLNKCFCIQYEPI